MTIRQAFAAGLLAMTPALTGCLSHTRSVPKTRLPDVVYNATLDQLLKQVDQRYNSIRTMTLFVQIVASTGGSLQGEVKDSLAFSGHIFIAKPDQLRTLLLVPLLGSRALDMVSDGKTFKMLIPPRNRAIIGSDEVTTPSEGGLYSLRPAVILDSMLIRGFGKDDIVTLTQDSRVIANPKKKTDLIEEPDYDIEFLTEPKDQIARTLRVVHISRANLMPYRQDIYGADGRIITQAFYDDYKRYGEINFPSKIVIKRPHDAYTLTITLTKGTTFNQKFDADEFDLGPIPTGYSVQNMDDPKKPAIVPSTPSAPHGPQWLR